MDKNWTDEERAKELQDKIINITPNTKENNIKFGLHHNQEGKEQVIKDAHHYIANTLGLKNAKIEMKDFPFPILIKDETINESITNSDKDKKTLTILSTTFANIKELCKNAILIDVQEYAYYWKQRKDNINADYFYISLLKMDDGLYPIKIMIEDWKNKEYSRFYLIISTEKIKEDDLMTGVHTDNTVESQSCQGTSSTISLSQVIENFNRVHSPILKHLPNELLSEEQILLKQELLKNDKERIERKHQRDIEKSNMRKK